MISALIYCAHPAQYHFIKGTLKNLIQDGHKVKVLIKTKDILENLLIEDGMEYTNIQPKLRKNNKLSILLASLQRTVSVIKEAIKFKADILIGTDSSIAQAAWILKKPAITTLEDDYDVIKNLAKLTFPFTTDILVPQECPVGEKHTRKKIPYSGYMKLAYLRPNVFTPDKSVLEKYNISEKFILIRLAKLTAHHDSGIKGLNIALVHSVISFAKNKGYTTYITSENRIDSSLEQYQLKIHYSDIHHILAFASLLISDSQSMSMEAAMLGIPSIRFSDFAGRISVLETLEKNYDLTFGIRTSEPENLQRKVHELLDYPNLHAEFQSRRQIMLADKIDVTAFFTWFIENYPESRKIMKENPEYQYRFK